MITDFVIILSIMKHRAVLEYITLKRERISVSDDQVYLYVSQYGDNPKDFLYIINVL